LSPRRELSTFFSHGATRPIKLSVVVILCEGDRLSGSCYSSYQKMMRTMKRLESVGGFLADLTHDDVLKLHFVSQFSHICSSLQGFN
jgi:hypothetical protein